MKTSYLKGVIGTKPAHSKPYDSGTTTHLQNLQPVLHEFGVKQLVLPVGLACGRNKTPTPNQAPTRRNQPDDAQSTCIAHFHVQGYHKHKGEEIRLHLQRPPRLANWTCAESTIVEIDTRRVFVEPESLVHTKYTLCVFGVYMCLGLAPSSRQAHAPHQVLANSDRTNPKLVIAVTYPDTGDILQQGNGHLACSTQLTWLCIGT